MRDFTNANTIFHAVADRQDRTNVAGMVDLRAHGLLSLRLSSRPARQYLSAYSTGGKRLAKPQLPSAVPQVESTCTVRARAIRGWRWERLSESLASAI